MEQFSTDSDEISLTQTPPPEENGQIFSINVDDSSLYNKLSINEICDPRGASSVVVNIDNDTLSRQLKDDCNLLSSKLEDTQIQPIDFFEVNQLSDKKEQQPTTQIFKSNSANLFEAQITIERHEQNDKMKKRPASSSCLFSSNFNSSFTNESSGSFNNDNNSSSRSNITVLRGPTSLDWGGSTANSSNNSNNSNKIHSCYNQSSECIEINVLESDTPPNSQTLPTATTITHSSTKSSANNNDNDNNQNSGSNNNSPSVILELPVIIGAQIESSSGSSNPTDPYCIPGTSRKWSKETLF
jgi:hypothetical protein